MSDPSLIYSYGNSGFDELFRDYEVVGDLKDLYTPFDRERVKNHSFIIIKFVISCIIATLLVVGFFLSVIVPCVLSLGTIVTLISSVVIVSLFFCLSLGAGLIFSHLHKKNDLFLGTPPSPCLQRVLEDTQILVAYPFINRYRLYNCCLDISTLDERGNGKCFGYLDIREKNFNRERQFRIISVFAILALPFITLGAIVYNLGRLLCVPVYILGHIIKQLITLNEEEDRFEVSDIFVEMLASLKRIVTAPFYAMAMFFSLIYSLVSLRSGRIITGIVERDWNEEVYLSFGFHLFYPLRLWKWEGGGKPKQLGKNGYYIAACMQPRYVFEVRDWRIVFGEKIFDRDPCAERDSNVAYIVALRGNNSSYDEKKGGGGVIS